MQGWNKKTWTKITCLARCAFCQPQAQAQEQRAPGGRTIRQVLFVGKNQQDDVTHFAVQDQLIKLATTLGQPIPVLTINHKDQALGTRVIVTPQGPDLVLAADILQPRPSVKKGSEKLFLWWLKSCY